VGQRRLQHRQQRRGDQRRLRTAVREHVGVVIRGQQRVDRHRHHAGVQRAEKGHRPVGVVVHQQQHALLAAQAAGSERRRAAPRAHLELPVAEPAGIVEVRGLARARRVQCEKVAGKVEALGQGLHCGLPLGHRLPPNSSCVVDLALAIRVGGDLAQALRTQWFFRRG